jgi:hypothetical protein
MSVCQERMALTEAVIFVESALLLRIQSCDFSSKACQVHSTSFPQETVIDTVGGSFSSQYRPWLSS